MASAARKHYVGLTVHHKEDREKPCQAAIITGVIAPVEGQRDLETITVTSFDPINEDHYWWTVDHSEDKHFPGTWHFADTCEEE